ncbi:sarcospan [Rhinatrema bivittatum]|uniref:sarcospan n=1 Tax=Rhinatrema bivittatum TaxID=194408 RepID=UPI001127B8A2|nr:sarcospan [Rhinatrema bivittatum]
MSQKVKSGMEADGINKPNTSLNDQKSSDRETKEKKAAMKKKGNKTEPKAGLEEESYTCWGCRFPLLFALLQLVLGISVTVVAFIMAGSSSSLLVRDTPHWAGIIVCVVALLGLCIFCMTYQADEKTSCQFAIKLSYFLLSALSLIICLTTVAFTAHHYSQVTQFTCKMILDTCECKLDTSDPFSRTFSYQDVSDCSTVTSTIKLYLLLQIILNLIIAVVSLMACFVMWKHRYQVFYVGNHFYSMAKTEIQQQQKV